MHPPYLSKHMGQSMLTSSQVKPNIGHGEAAAGLSSLIKAVLALEHKIIPPNIKFHTPNPRSKCSDLCRMNEFRQADLHPSSSLSRF
jgi:3-oxoacyl-(acyl-carrier-protein) synthase